MRYSFKTFNRRRKQIYAAYSMTIRYKLSDEHCCASEFICVQMLAEVIQKSIVDFEQCRLSHVVNMWNMLKSNVGIPVLGTLMRTWGKSTIMVVVFSYVGVGDDGYYVMSPYYDLSNQLAPIWRTTGANPMHINGYDGSYLWRWCRGWWLSCSYSV